MAKAYTSRRPGSQARNGPNAGPEQGDLFRHLAGPALPPADLDIHFELLGAIAFALREARARGVDRDDVVRTMNRLLPDIDPCITKRQLDAWCATSKRESHPFPVRFLAAFCAATDCDLPIRKLAQAIGCDLIDGREQVARQLGENLIERARLQREERDLKRRLGS